MKLSKREKFLILLLIVTVIGYLVFTYVPFGKVFNLDELKAEHSQKSRHMILCRRILCKKILLKKKFCL